MKLYFTIQNDLDVNQEFVYVYSMIRNTPALQFVATYNEDALATINVYIDKFVPKYQNKQITYKRL